MNYKRAFQEKRRTASSSVFPECEIAFCTPEELRGGFIASSGLHLPDEG